MTDQDCFYYVIEIRKGGFAISNYSLSEIASLKSAGNYEDEAINSCDGNKVFDSIEDARDVKTYAKKWLKDCGISHLYEVVIVKNMFCHDVK
jgi:hypothetical protein